MRISLRASLFLLVSFVWLNSAAAKPPQSIVPLTYPAYTGTDPKPLPTPPVLGPANTAFTDPTFGTRILRVTDQNTKSGRSFISIDAGFVRAWNADSTAIKLTGPQGDGYWLEFSPTSFRVGVSQGSPELHQVPFGSKWEWSVVDPNIIYYLNGNQIAKYNKSTGTSVNLGGPANGDPLGYFAVVVGQDNWVCAAAGPGVQDSRYKIFCLNPVSPSISKFIDVKSKTINDVPQGDPNWPMAAAGKVIGIHSLAGGTGASWLEVTFHQHNWGANGGAVFNLGTNTWSLVTNGDLYWSGHVSMGNGIYANSSGSINGLDSRGMVLRNPDNLMQSNEYRFIDQPPNTSNRWCDSDHSSWLNSLTNPNAPILISRYYGDASCYQYAWTGEISAAAVDGSNTVWRFAHNHNTGSSCYFGQAFAQISNDGRWALFSSPWSGTLGSDTAFGCSSRIDTFIVDLTGLSGAPASVFANPPSIPAGQTATATWTGIVSPSATDWIGLYEKSSANTGYLEWNYVNCSKTAGSPTPSGSCGFVLPNNLSPGTYQFRLFANNGFTLLATGSDFTVTGSGGGQPFSVSPTVVSPGGAVTVTWAGNSTSSTDWIGLYEKSSANTGYLEWNYVNCSKTAGSPNPSGSCGFVLPYNLSPGTYQFRLFANNGFALLATGNDFTVTGSAGGQPLTVSPTVASPGGAVTVTWAGNSTSSTDWIGLYEKGSPNTGYLEWNYVNCSKTAGSPNPSGSCGFVLPYNLSPGTYQFRLFANNGFTLLATGSDFTLTGGGQTFSVSPTVVLPPGGALP